MSRAVFQISYTAKTPPRHLSPKQSAEYWGERKFFNWTADYNYTSYILNAEKVEKNKDAKDYFSRQGNLGLFNMDGIMNEEQVAEVAEKLSKTDSIIWHGFISFDAETSKGFQTQGSAIKFLKQSFGKFLNCSHLKQKNIELVAALHTDTDNRHIHFSFFEKEPRTIDKNGIHGFTTKGVFKQQVIDNYLISANMYLEENKDEYVTVRDNAVGQLKNLRSAGSQVFSNKEVKEKLMQFSLRLPVTGRIGYNSKNMMSLRGEVDALSNMIMQLDPIAASAHKKTLLELSRKDETAKKIAIENNIDVKTVFIANKLRNDYMSRLGNQVIGLATEMRRNFRQVNRANMNGKEKKIMTRRARQHSTRIFKKFISTLTNIQKGVQANFSQDLKTAEQELQMEQWRATQ
jgi:hypothetical protein